ncbi:vitelline membrane outer layer protein 1-like [Siphateles boraxobius]|uniref:vitelline membrane outer layer protein 1-like n=1 Tax=Siphateles boraxobius TaxID=180520 RepID=UPI0040642E25
MHHFLSIFLLLAIIGHVSGQSAKSRSERGVHRHYRSELWVWNGMSWGSWGFKSMCPVGMYAAGFSLKVERPVGRQDDTALNGIQLHCVYTSKESSESYYYNSIESNAGRWGEWTDIKWCYSGYLTAFQLKVESSQGRGDDTAANNIKFTCSNGDVLWGDGTNWGDWGDWSSKCHGKGICGLNTRIEKPQGDGDDTALNDVIMFCCD